MQAPDSFATVFWCPGCLVDVPPEEVSRSDSDTYNGLLHQCGDVAIQAAWMIHRDHDEVFWRLVSEHGEVLDTRVQPQERFRVHDQGSAEWVLRRMFEAEAAAAAARARADMLMRNAMAEVAHLDAEAKALHRRFDEELEAFTREALDGKKVKSIKTPWGKLALRKSQAKWIVVDEKAAIAWAREHAPAGVEDRPHLLIGRIPDPDEPAKPHAVGDQALVWKPARDEFSVDTGHGKAAKS